MEKIFNSRSISLATFIGGPLSAGILISKNYKAFGNDEAAKTSMFIGVISTVFLFAIIFLIPENIMSHIPNALFPAIYTLIITLLVNKYQGDLIKQYLDNDGIQASYWSAAGYGSIGLIVILGFLFSMIFLFNSNGYNNKSEIQKGVLLYHNNNDIVQTNKLIQAIKYSGFMGSSEGADLFLDEENDKIMLGFVLPNMSVLSDTLVTNDFNNLEKYLNYNLNLNKPLKFYFTNTELKKRIDLPKSTIKVYGYEPIFYLKPNQINEYQTIYCNCFTPFTDVQKVIKAINNSQGYFPLNSKLDVIFLNQDSYYEIKFFVPKSHWSDQRIINALNSTVAYINYLGIKGKIKIRLIDNQTLDEQKL